MRLTGQNAASVTSDAPSAPDEDRVQPLEPALWKQLGEATPDGLTGIVKDLGRQVCQNAVNLHVVHSHSFSMLARRARALLASDGAQFPRRRPRSHYTRPATRAAQAHPLERKLSAMKSVLVRRRTAPFESGRQRHPPETEPPRIGRWRRKEARLLGLAVPADMPVRWSPARSI